MKIKIKSFNGALPDYLTIGKVYKIIDDMHEVAVIQDDNSREQLIMFFDCPHLSGGSWEIVNETQ